MNGIMSNRFDVKGLNYCLLLTQSVLQLDTWKTHLYIHFYNRPVEEVLPLKLVPMT